MTSEYYVYAWFFKSTNKVFHIGKGKGNRYLERKQSRNQYFKNIIEKHPNDVAVKKLYENLTNQEACELERTLITEYKAIGECETNLHEGGCGGNTGNYDSPERREKLSQFAKTRTGENNSNFGKQWSVSQREAQSKKLKAVWQDETKKANMLANRDYANKIPWNKGKTGFEAWNKGKTLTEEHYNKMMSADCHFKYEIWLDAKLVYWCLGHSRLYRFCKEQFSISRTIVDQIVKETWQPKFEKHKYLKSLKIIRIDRSVSTNRDECSDVEWRLQTTPSARQLEKVDEIVR